MMKRAEEMLREYPYLKRELSRLMRDLALARHAYEHCAAELPSSCRYSVVKDRNRRIAKPVEINVMIMIDEYRAQVESIEKRLTRTRRDMESMEKTVEQAGLSAREREYINFRYFSGLSAEAAAQRMYCSESTCRRIRRDALEKIMRNIEQRGKEETTC